MAIEPFAPKAGPVTLIAPCGMNCSLCHAYQRDHKKCPGCRGEDAGKPKTRAGCKLKLCGNRTSDKADFCTSCPNFPCERLCRLNRRYRAKYAMSMIENLMQLEELGLPRFLKRERAKWTCPGCGSLLCVHKDRCLECGHRWR
jgi:hypothetical protein